MEFGMFHEFPSVPGRTETEMFDESMEQIDGAERWGLDVMWLAEIHFAPERTYLSAPLAIASAIAGRTERMKIGIAVQVLPLCHPLRLAEEAATVDQVSKGRLIFGVGRSGVVSTYDAYQVPYDESRERFAETLDVVKAAWSQPRFSYAGKFYSFQDVACSPHPYRNKMPPIRIAASTPDTFPTIGGLGYPVFASTRHSTWTEVVGQVDSYQNGWKQAGRAGRGHAYVAGPMYIAETDRQARDEARESVEHFYRLQYELIAEFGAPLGPAEFHRPRRAPQEPDLRGRDPRQRHRGIAGNGRQPAQGIAGTDRLRRHPRRTQLRRHHPARTSPQRATPAVPGGKASISVKMALSRPLPAAAWRVHDRGKRTACGSAQRSAVVNRRLAW